MSRRDVLVIVNCNGSSTVDQVVKALDNIESSFLGNSKCMLLKSMEDCGYAMDAIANLLKTSSNHLLLARGASCIAAMAHSSEDRRRQLVRKDVGCLLLSLCCPRPRNSFIPEVNLLLHEYSAYALQKLSFQSEDGQGAILSLDGAKVLLDLASSYCSSSNHHTCCSFIGRTNGCSSDASEELNWLAVGRKLVGRVRPLTGSAASLVIQTCALDKQRQPDADLAFSVDLYDTTTNEDVLINEYLAQLGLVWASSHAKQDDETLWPWLMVEVTSMMVDGVHFWAKLSPYPDVDADELFAGVGLGEEVPCCLSGVVPSQQSKSLLLQRVAGTLRNLCNNNLDGCSQVIRHDGMRVLGKMCQLPDIKVCEQAVGALLNIAQVPSLRQPMGDSGVLIEMLELCDRCLECESEDTTDLLQLCVACVYWLLEGCFSNRFLVGSQRQWTVLLKVLKTGPPSLRDDVLATLKALLGQSVRIGNDDNEHDNYMLPDIPAKAVVSVEEMVDRDELDEILIPKVGERFYHRTERCSVPTQVSLPRELLSVGVASASDDDDVELKETKASHEYHVLDASEPHYAVGSRLGYTLDQTHDFRYQWANYKNYTVATLCGFLNSGKGGTMYLGVKPSGVVSGVHLSRKQRDDFRLCLDRNMHDCKPVVSSNLFNVEFVPVTETSALIDGKRLAIENLFVVEVSVKAVSGIFIMTSNDKCYMRDKAVTKQISMQDVRNITISEMEERYVAEIKSLHCALRAVQQQLELQS